MLTMSYRGNHTEVDTYLALEQLLLPMGSHHLRRHRPWRTILSQRPVRPLHGLAIGRR